MSSIREQINNHLAFIMFGTIALIFFVAIVLIIPTNKPKYKVVTPVPGQECIIVSNDSGVAVDCWKDETIKVPNVDVIFEHHSCAIGGKHAG